MIIGICGFIGSGKDTAANYLVGWHGFRRDSFAGALKDAVATVFGWDRELLEGLTPEARVWREQVDPWWAKRLDMPKLTPRWVLQYWGTEVCRKGFNDDIWIASLENKLSKSQDNIVISDVRFPNEVAAIKRAGGMVVRVVRGDEPVWFDTARLACQGNKTALDAMENVHCVHASEWAWTNTEFDVVVDNNGTINDLFKQSEMLAKNQQLDLLASI